MEIFEVIKKRRSIRKYQDIPVKEDKMLKIIDAGILAPSAANGQPWRFIALRDRVLLDKVVKEALGTINQWAITAPLIIIGCSIKSNIITHYFGEVVSGIKYHLIDMGITLEHMVLEAEDLGLSSCWIGWFNEKKIKKILDINYRWRITALLAIGYADNSYIPSPQKRIPREKILTIK
jgi:nitroreductase